jgi:hypothetical protein
MASTMTAADWAALAAAGAEGGTAYLEALNAQEQQIQATQAQELQGIPGVSGGSLGGVPSTSGQYTLGQDAINLVQTEYPNLAWLLSVPELGPQIVQWAQQGLDPTAAEAEFESTQWYQTHSDNVRAWITEVETDPAQAQADVASQESAINATLKSMGLNATQSQLQDLSTQSLVFGWTDQQIKDNIAAAIVPQSNGTFSFNYAGQMSASSQQQSAAGTLAASVDSINAEAAKYLVPVSQSTAQSFASAIAQGTMDSTAVDAYFQAQATSLYPSIANAIQQGITPADYVTPYKEVAAQLLGVDPNSIDMTQSKWNRPLSVPGPGGVPQAQSLYSWQQTLMTDPQYGYLNTVNAKDRAASIAQGIAEMFGKSAAGPSGSTAFQAAGAPTISGVPIT